jgi:hypothetical protein
MHCEYPRNAQIGRNSRNTFDFVAFSGRNKCMAGMASVTTCFSRLSGLVTTVTTYSPLDRFQAVSSATSDAMSHHKKHGCGAAAERSARVSATFLKLVHPVTTP